MYLRSYFREKKDTDLQTALIEVLKEPVTQTIDPLDGFFVRLGEGMRYCHTEIQLN